MIILTDDKETVWELKDSDKYMTGWICPRCGTVHSPWKTECDNVYCFPRTYTSANPFDEDIIGKICRENHPEQYLFRVTD